MKDSLIFFARAHIRVLHVDDESDYRYITKLFLEKYDSEIQVESASSGEEALQLLKEQSFDCVVSDYLMPTMDGLKLCTLVREQCQHPFILYTGSSNEEVAEKAYTYGAIAFVRKEMGTSHFRVLANHIRTAVQSSRIRKDQY